MTSLAEKKSMIITILGFSVATFAVGLLPTYAVVGVLAPILLILVRLIQGIFAGGEWGSGAVLTIESVPKQKRGLISGFLQSGFSFGFLLAAISFQMEDGEEKDLVQTELREIFNYLRGEGISVDGRKQSESDAIIKNAFSRGGTYWADFEDYQLAG